jgi:hypothetical protein
MLRSVFPFKQETAIAALRTLTHFLFCLPPLHSGYSASFSLTPEIFRANRTTTRLPDDLTSRGRQFKLMEAPLS